MLNLTIPKLYSHSHLSRCKTPARTIHLSRLPFKKQSRNHTTMHLRLSLLLLLVIAATTPLMPSSSASVPHQPPGGLSECTLSLVALSPCLPYVAGPPNSPAPAPSVVCCGTFFQIFVTAGPTCLCYLVQDPMILGFPVDTSRLAALLPSCGANNTASAVQWLYDTCRVVGMETMLPLPGVAIAPSPASPSPARAIIPNSADMWAQAPTPAMSIAPRQAGKIQLLIEWLMLSVVLLI